MAWDTGPSVGGKKTVHRQNCIALRSVWCAWKFVSSRKQNAEIMENGQRKYHQFSSFLARCHLYDVGAIVAKIIFVHITFGHGLRAKFTIFCSSMV